MFVSEHLLLNTTVCILQQVDKKDDEWEKRDIIFTDRALYIFAQVQNEREQTLNYLTAPYERLKMVDFTAKNPTQVDDPNSNEPPQPPVYQRWLPYQTGPYCMVVELHHETTGKMRLVALANEHDSNSFVDLFNLVSFYRRYEAVVAEEGAGKDEGPEFISKWVRSYLEHKGIMKMTSEMLNRKNSEYFYRFARKNPSIKGLVFDSSLVFSNASKRQQREEQNNDLVQSLQAIFEAFEIQRSLKEVRFTGNVMDDSIFKGIASYFQPHNRLITLEISYNELGDESLGELASALSDNKNLEEIILNNNKLGNSGTERFLVTFLEAFLLELRYPQKLDLSCNQIGDVCLEPIIFYLLANQNCQITNLNIEYNSFSNFSKRTIAQACLLCSNTDLKVRYGPMALTERNLQVATCIKQPKAMSDEELKNGISDQINRRNEKESSVTLTINRKPAFPKLGMRYLPIGKYETDQLQKIKEKINHMCQFDVRNTIYSEDIRETVEEITGLQFEFPKHLIQPLFHLINQKLTKAIQVNDLYQLEILLDALYMMDSSNEKAEQKYQELKAVAINVSYNLLRAINMEIHDDPELLKVLVVNLDKAKEIGMRGEIVDFAKTLKALCVKLLQEMLGKNSNQEEEDDPSKQVFMVKEEDLRRSVYDPYYDNFIDQDDKNLTTELEPNLALHPFKTDYVSIASLNLNYLKKNMALSRKFLSDEETYSLLNIYVRCAFILCDSKQDSSKSLEFNNARDDKLLRYARLLFRYRHNLDELFSHTIEPITSYAFSKSARDQVMPEILFSEYTQTKRIEQYPGIERMDITFSEKPITKPLVETQPGLKTVALKFSQSLCALQLAAKKDIKNAYKLIRQLFEEFIIKSSSLIVEEMADEFYLQLYRQSNTVDSDVKVRPIFLIIAFLSRYMIPSPELIPYYTEWLQRKHKDHHLERLIKLILANFKLMTRPENQLPSEKNSHVTWPPSITEIKAADNGKSIKVKIIQPDDKNQVYDVDESTTVENLMNQQIFKSNKKNKGHFEVQFYWLYSKEQDSDHFPMALSKEKRILKLIYRDEIQFEQNLDYEKNFLRSNTLMRQTITSKERPRESEINKVISLDSESTYQGLSLRLRKRIFTSLHSMPKFKSLNKEALNFIFHQIRGDYTDFEILRRPVLSLDNAYLLASLALQVKRFKKMMTSKDTILKKEEIQKNLDFCVPKHIQRDKATMATWEQNIMQCFMQQNINDLTIEEAQEQFLTLISSYRIPFGSFFTVQRKPSQGLLMISKNQITGLSGGNQVNIQSRKQMPNSLNSLRDRVQKQKTGKKKQGATSKFANGSSNDDSSSSSSESEQEQKSVDISVEESNNDSSNPSTFLDKSGLSMQSSHEKNSEVLEDLFPQFQQEILMVVTYEQIIFMDNSERNQIILEIKHEDLLYMMGKKDQLKIAFQINSSLVNGGGMDRQKTQMFQKNTKSKAQTNENYQSDVIDVKTTLIVPNARVVAEDIIAYIQVNLLEMTKSKEYIEILQPQFVDFLALGDSNLNKSMENNQGEGGEKSALKQGMNIAVNDDLLMGITTFKTTTASKLKEMGAKSSTQLEGSGSKANTQLSLDQSQFINNDNDSRSDDSPSHQSEGGTFDRGQLTASQRYEKKIQKRAGHQFRLKKSDFMIYVRKHPTYVSMNPNADSTNGRINLTKTNMTAMNKKALVARETLTGTSFILETHTINEESEHLSASNDTSSNVETSSINTDSSLKSSNMKRSLSSSQRNFDSLPRYADQLDKIEEEPYEENKYVSANVHNHSNRQSPLAGDQEKKMSLKPSNSGADIKAQYEPIRTNATPSKAPRPPAPRGNVPRPPPRGNVPRPPPQSNLPRPPPVTNQTRPKAPIQAQTPVPPAPRPKVNPRLALGRPAMPRAPVRPKQTAVATQPSEQSVGGKISSNEDARSANSHLPQLHQLKKSASDNTLVVAPAQTQAAVSENDAPLAQPKEAAPAITAPAFDFKNFIASSAQAEIMSNQPSDQNSTTIKEKVALDFAQKTKEVPRQSRNFEKKTNTQLKSGMASVLAGLPPPPPPP